MTDFEKAILETVDNWIDVNVSLPDVYKLGDGNACLVDVKDAEGEFQAIYGTSGAPGEPISFFSQRPITHWRPSK